MCRAGGLCPAASSAACRSYSYFWENPRTDQPQSPWPNPSLSLIPFQSPTVSVSAGVTPQEIGPFYRWEKQSTELQSDSPGSPEREAGVRSRSFQSQVNASFVSLNWASLISRVSHFPWVQCKALGCFGLGRALYNPSKIACSHLGRDLGMTWVSVSMWKPLI